MKTKTRFGKFGWTLLPVVLLAVAFRLRWFSSSGVILCGSPARSLFSQCSRDTPHHVSGYFVASWSDADRIESALPNFLSHQKQGGWTPNFSDYHFQYAGFTRQGRDLIYINAFTGECPYTWRFLPVTVCDGGSSFFGVEYDVATGQFSHLEFNGAA